MYKACIDRSDSLTFNHQRRPCAPKYKKKNYNDFTNESSKVHFRFTEGQTFYWSIMTVDDSIKCRFANSGVTDQVGGFQNPGVCLQAFPSFLPRPLPALLLEPLFSLSLTLVPRSFLLNRTETLATQASFYEQSPCLTSCNGFSNHISWQVQITSTRSAIHTCSYRLYVKKRLFYFKDMTKKST